jgi:putative glycosyltransferase (TIGR04372 family)
MIQKIIKTFKREGIVGFFRYGMDRVQLKKIMMRLMLAPLAIPLAVILLIISPWWPIRLMLLFSNRIGHYAYNTDLLLTALDFCSDPSLKKRKTFFYTAYGRPICNTQLHIMWKRVITILPFPRLISEVDRYFLRWSKRYQDDPIKKFFISSAGWDAWDVFSKTPQPHIAFTEEEEYQGKQFLNELGIPVGKPFVCIHGRDPVYLKLAIPNQDFTYTSYRNVTINNYKKAAEFLTRQGYYVVRMGKHVQDRFDFGNPMVIDYANSPLRSDFGDIYLSKHCFFFISVGSGLDAVPQTWRVPILQTNVTLVDPDFPPDWYLFITKKVFNTRTKKYLTQEEISTIFTWEKINGARVILDILKEEHLELIENTPEELLESVKEMLARMTHTWPDQKEEESLQKEFWRYYKDPGVRRMSSCPPSLTIPTLKTPLYEGENMEINRKLGVRLRIGCEFLKNNAAWLINHPYYTANSFICPDSISI